MNQIDFLINCQYVSDCKTIANTFNNYFINVGSLLVSSIQSEIHCYIFNLIINRFMSLKLTNLK